MSDERIEANLAAYIDDVLSPEDRASIERLLAENPRHRRMVQEMQKAQSLLATLPIVRAPADLADGVDPALERSALLGEDDSARGILARLMAPQVLALAATVILLLSLLATAIFLLPGDHDGELAGGPGGVGPDEREDRPAETVPEQDEAGAIPLDGRPGVGETPPDDVTSDDDDEEDSEDEGMQEDADAMEDDQDSPDPTDDPSPDAEEAIGAGDDTGDATVEWPMAPDPGVLADAGEIAGDALVLRAEVGSLPDASGVVAQFLTAAEMPISGQRVQLSDLPESLRETLGELDSGEVQLYVVDSLLQEQARGLLESLGRVGQPVLMTAPERPEVVAGDPDGLRTEVPQTAEVNSRPTIDVEKQRQALRVFPRDELYFVITRKGEVPEEPTPGIPPLEETTHFRLNVSDDGYLDLAPVGLGRTDVLGQDLDTLEEMIRQRLADDYQIGTSVNVAHARRADIPAGRTDEEIEYLVVDREPITPGTMLRITLPEGGVIDTVVGEDGKAAAGALGEIDTTGQSVTDLQRTLREAVAETTTRPTTSTSTTTTATLPQPGKDSEPRLSVTNLSVRRNVDEVGEPKRPLLIILTPSRGAAGDWEGLSLDPTTQPTEPSTSPTTGPRRSPTR